MNEEALLNEVGQYLLDEVRRTFSEVYPSRGFTGQQKPVKAQFPPVYSSKIATGEYVNSLKYRINTDTESNKPYIEIYSTLPPDKDYGGNIDAGRANFTKFPPPFAIEKWISAKGIERKSLASINEKGVPVYRIPTLKQLTFLISRSIAQEGIFPFPFRDITLARVEKNLAKKLEPALAQHVTRLIREQVVFIINPGRQTR